MVEPRSNDPARSLLVHAHGRHPNLVACRVLDVLVALAGLAIAGPAMLLVALAIAVEGRGPILFRHTRLGCEGKPFQVLKFRSMAVDGDRILADHLAHDPEAAAEWARDHKLRDDPRVSRLGRILRKSSLDELPQLFNVLKGEMSIVGPRPIVQAEVARYGRAYTCYCAVPPGITGIWQVSGRNDISYRRRVAMDALYSRRKNVMLDLQLILATVPAVLTRRGSY